jgi:ABC-type cobalamin transport system ATPase subunit
LGKIRIEFDNTEVLIFDIYTISKTEKGYAEEFQGVSMALKLNDKLKGRIYVRD